MLSIVSQSVRDFTEGEVAEVGESVLGKLEFFVSNDFMRSILCGKASSS